MFSTESFQPWNKVQIKVYMFVRLHTEIIQEN